MNIIFLPFLIHLIFAPVPTRIVAPTFAAEIVAACRDYVPSDPGQVGLFVAAWQRGSLGLLAHDYLTGAAFDELRPGDRLAVYGGGVRVYRVAELRYFAKVNQFDDLAEQGWGAVLTQDQVLAMIYQPGRLVLQTCAGRGFLFVIAELARPASIYHNVAR